MNVRSMTNAQLRNHIQKYKSEDYYLTAPHYKELARRLKGGWNTARRMRVPAYRKRVYNAFRSRGGAAGRLRNSNYGRHKFVPGLSRATGKPEYKFKDSATSSGTGGGTWSAATPNQSFFDLIAVGTGASNRIGRKIRCKSARMTVTLENGAATSKSAGIIIIKDMQCNGSPLSRSEVFTNNGTVLLAPLNLSNTPRFKVLYRKHFSLAADGQPGATRHEVINLNMNELITWSTADTTGAAANLRDNNIQAFIYGEDIDVSHTNTVRVRFTDE